MQLGDEGMNAILESHLIPATALRADDFDAFYSARKSALLALIERVMGKQLLAAPLREVHAEEAEDAEDELVAAE